MTGNYRTSRAALLLAIGVAWTAAAASDALPRQTPASAAKTQDFSSELDALLERFHTARDAYRAELDVLYRGIDEETATDEQRAALEKKRAPIDAKAPGPSFVKEFAALAERAKGTDVAAKALMQVLALDTTRPGVADSPGRKALATLLADHIRSPALDELPTILQYAPSIDRKLRGAAYAKLASASPVARIQAESLFLRATELTLDESRGGDQAEARRIFADLQARFGALASPRNRTYAALAEGFLFELDHLQLGMHAPDFAATDENGSKFKLSDYAGKVVVVDFWGYW